MTVGLILNNRDYGVAIADSRVTIGNERSADLANKLLLVNAKGYSGAMIGAGSARSLYYVFERVRAMKQAILKKLLEKIRDESLEYPLSIQSQIADAEKEIIGRLRVGREEEPQGLEEILGQKARSEEQEKLHRQIRKNLSRITNVAANPKLKMPMNCAGMQGGIEDFVTHEIIFAAYDKSAGCIRKYVIHSICYGEDSSFQTITGSGADSAELELMKLMPGVKLKSLRHPVIAFFSLCAYVRATQNLGVGGTPKIALLSRERTRVLKKSESIALANITSAYQAELINRAFAEQSVEGIITGKADYEEIAGGLGMNAQSICGPLTPLDNWLAYANGKRYGKQRADRCLKTGRPCKCSK